MPPQADALIAAVPEDLLGLCRRLRESGKRAWIVGGCVRDLLRDKPASDWDVATDARPEEVQKIFRRVVPTGIKHGTVTVLLGKSQYEVTTLRGDGAYTDGRRPDSVAFVDDITEDLARRDFTFNAIALDPLRGEVIDPFDGQGDLARRLVRAVGEAERRFTEDGLRVLRAARFAASLECEIEPGTLAAMGRKAPLDTLARVSNERVRDEWIKSLRARRPSVAFAVLETTRALDVVSAELRPMVAHESGAWAHALRAVDALPPGDPILRLAALLHDIGLPAVGREGHAEKGAELVDALLMRLKFSNEERKRVALLVRDHDIGALPELDDAGLRRWLRKSQRVALADHLALARANAAAQAEGSEAALARVEGLARRLQGLVEEGVVLGTGDLAVTGADLMRELGLAPGRRVGELLAQLVEVTTDAPRENERERLLAAARQLLGEAGP
jgi:tRNA nucleotidyltransferase (CCA-adding enzyme)